MKWSLKTTHARHTKELNTDLKETKHSQVLHCNQTLLYIYQYQYASAFL